MMEQNISPEAEIIEGVIEVIIHLDKLSKIEYSMYKVATLKRLIRTTEHNNLGIKEKD